MSSAQPYLGDTSRSPVVACSIGAIVSAFLAIGIIASSMPKLPPLAWSVGFLVLAAALTAAAIGFLLRRPAFAWPLFWQVARWVLVLPAVFAGMALFVFVYDGTPGSTLAVMVPVLLLTAVNIPLLVGFSVARHERV